MKQIIVILIFLTCINAQSQIERDKALHFLGGNLYGLAGAGIAKQISDGNRYWTFVGAIGGATLIGLGKDFEIGLVLESSSQYDFPNKELPSLNSFSIPESVKTLE